jgi:hypothetical protein
LEKKTIILNFYVRLKFIQDENFTIIFTEALVFFILFEITFSEKIFKNQAHTDLIIQL